MSANTTKGNDEGEIDVGTLKPPARRDSTAAREHNEAAAFKKTDGRALRRKGRTELISWRIFPRPGKRWSASPRLRASLSSRCLSEALIFSTSSCGERNDRQVAQDGILHGACLF